MFAKLLLALGCAVGISLAGAQEPGAGRDWQLPQDRSLRHTLAAIERGFSQEDLSQLGQVFPRQDKIFLRWEHPVHHDGLLTRKQVILFLKDLFLKHRTVTFKLQSGSLVPPGRLYHCMGGWSFTASGGRTKKIELHFSLKQDAGVWTIRELRQTH